VAEREGGKIGRRLWFWERGFSVFDKGGRGGLFLLWGRRVSGWVGKGRG